MNMENQEAKNEALIGGSVLNAGLGGWISVDDALPEPKVQCLTFTSDGLYQIRKMNAHKFSEFYGNKVTYWMNLSKPPNVELSTSQQRTEKL